MSNRRLFLAILYVDIILIFFIAILSFICIEIITNKSKENSIVRNSRGSYTYQSIHYDDRTKEVSHGFTTIQNRLFGDDFISSPDGSYMISNFGTFEFRCTGSCACEGEEVEEDSFLRRSSSIATRRIFTVLVASLTSISAINIANKQFRVDCEENCGSDSSFVSAVEDCEMISEHTEQEEELENEEDESLSEYICKGKCIDKWNYLKYVPPEEFTMGESCDYEVEDSENEIFPLEKSTWRKWLEENHLKKDHVWVYMWKTKAKKVSIDYDECLDECLCFGWIDGGWRTLSDELIKVRFTPRREGSKWAQTNLHKARKCIAEGKMTDRGMEEYEKWLKVHPDDEASHCEKWKMEKEVELDRSYVIHKMAKGKRKKMFGEYSDVEKMSNLELVKNKFMSELHRFCFLSSKEEKKKAGNNLVVRCVGHQSFENPTVHCVKRKKR